MKQITSEIVQALSMPTADALKLASGATSQNCPKCGGESIMPTRQGMSLPYKCTACGQSFRLLIATSDLSQLKSAYDGEADVGMAGYNIRIAGKLVQSENIMTPSIEEIKALNGKVFALLSEQENEVLNFYRDQGRKHGVAVSIINEADPDELARARSKEQADEIMKSANSRVSVTIEAA